MDAEESVITGCTAYPVPNKTYCGLHEGEPTPVADNVSFRTRKVLKDYQEESRESELAGDDQAYIIEFIIDILVDENQETMYKVKWCNFPVEASTLI